MANLFKKSDPTTALSKVRILAKMLRRLLDREDRIEIEVDLLTKANHAMAKTIKKNRYKED